MKNMILLLFLLMLGNANAFESEELFFQMTLVKSKYENPATLNLVAGKYLKYAIGTDEWGSGRNSLQSWKDSWMECKDVYLFRTSFRNIEKEDSRKIKVKIKKDALDHKPPLPVPVFRKADPQKAKTELDKIPLANVETGELSELSNPEELTDDDS